MGELRGVKALIIGGGVIGAAVAWRIAAEGVRAIVFERARLGAEASWAAAGLIDPQAESQEPGVFYDLARAGKRAFDEIAERLVAESGIDPEYDRKGVVFVAFDGDGAEKLRERAKWQRESGATIEELTAAEARILVPMLSPDIECAFHMPGNGRVDNRILTAAYIRAAENAGAEFREGAQVAQIVTRGGRAVGIRLADGTVEEGDVVINSAGAWAGEIRGLEADTIRFFPVRGQIICFDIRPGMVGPSIFCADGILVSRRDGRLLAGSVFEDAGFNKSVTLGAMTSILATARRMVPTLADAPFREAWAGLRPATDDLLPVIGESPSVSRVLYAAGHFRSGILLSALTADVIADLVMGRTPRIDLAPFSPARFRDGKIRRAELPHQGR